MILRKVKGFLSVACLMALLLQGANLRADLIELWDTGSSDWHYFKTNAPLNGDGDMTWHADGGVDNSGFVSCPLDELSEWQPTPGLFYPMYAYSEDHPVDLIQAPRVSIGVRDHDGNLNLNGGVLRFWVGQWTSDDAYYFAYFNNTAISPTDSWVMHVVNTTTTPDDWSVMGASGPVPDLSSLLQAPQQWGFAVAGSGAAPTGILGFDSLSIVPEPGSGCLILAAAALGLPRRRRRRAPAY